MNIALITNNFLPIKGGISNVMINVSKNLTQIGEKVYVLNKSYHKEDKLYFKILSNDNTLKGILVHNIKFFYFLLHLIFKILFSFEGISIKGKLKLIGFYCFYSKFLVRRIISIRNLVKHFKKYKIDTILSGAANIPLFYSFILSKWFKIPLITIAHGDDFLIKYPFGIKTYILRNLQKIIVTNRIMGKFIAKIHNLNPEMIKVIHLGVDPSQSIVNEPISDLRNNFDIGEKEFAILTVSRFYPRKGFETVLRALKLIVDENPTIQIKYYIIGGGVEQKKIEFLISRLNLEKYVKLLGSVDDSIKNKYFKLSDLFILVPEVKKDSIEGFGIVYIEANYFNLPVIGSRTGGVKLAIEDGRTGFLIEPKDELNLKQKIMLLYEDEQLRHKLGEYGHYRVLEDFNWQKIVLDYKYTLANVLKENYKNNSC